MLPVLLFIQEDYETPSVNALQMYENKIYQATAKILAGLEEKKVLFCRPTAIYFQLRTVHVKFFIPKYISLLSVNY